MPPVEISSTPSSVQSPGKIGTIPVLSVTLSSARSILAINTHFSRAIRDCWQAVPPYNRNVPHYCTLIPGDGIGPEVAQATVRAVDATGVDIAWERAELNEAIILEAGKTLPQYVLDSLDRDACGLKGPVTTPVAGGFQSVNVALRKTLDLFANVRPVRTLPGIKTRFTDVPDRHGDLPREHGRSVFRPRARES